jgi:hypothetical protein
MSGTSFLAPSSTSSSPFIVVEVSSKSVCGVEVGPMSRLCSAVLATVIPFPFVLGQAKKNPFTRCPTVLSVIKYSPLVGRMRTLSSPAIREISPA